MKQIRLYEFTVFALLAIICLFPDLVIAEDSFFGNKFSASEKARSERELGELTKAVEAIDDLQLLLQYSSFQEGECEEFLEIEGKAKQGDPKNQWILSDLYKKGLCVNKDDAEAIKWLIKAAEQGYKSAFMDLGIYYKEGWGTEKNPQKAFNWFQKAAENEDRRAFYFLGFMYFSGKGVIPDYQESLKWTLLGAEIGDKRSQTFAAILLSQEGFKFFNLKEAYKWALLASQSNDENIKESANTTIEKLNKEMSIEEVQTAQKLARVWKPKEKEKENSVITLPELSDNYADDFTPEKALEKLESLGIGKDRLIFFQSIQEDNLGLFKLFIKAGVSIETTGLIDNTPPLYRSANLGNKKIFEFLIAAGADINTPVNYANDTPILTALSNGHFDIAERLLSLGADVSHPGIIYHAVESNDRNFLEKFYKAGATSIDNDYVGTPLMNATSGVRNYTNFDRHCYLESAIFLLEKGADPNFIDNSNESILTRALTSINPVPCISLLLKYKADTTYKMANGESALYRAVLLGHPKLVGLLLNNGANSNEVYYFEKNQIPYILEKEISKSILVSGGTPLMIAVSEGHASAARELIQHGADPKKETKNGVSALSIAQDKKDKIMIDIMSSLH